MKDDSKVIARAHPVITQQASNVEAASVKDLDKAITYALGEIEDHFDIDSDNSPFPEVRANVPNTDGPSMPVNTPRMWILGVLFTMIGSGINQFFSMRYPGVAISSLVSQLVSYPVGCAVVRLLPVKKVRVFGRWDLTLNPDHNFNIKEHASYICLLTLVDNVVVNNLFGMSTGLAYLPITFDWSQIAYNGSPLVVPFWAQANVFAGWVVIFALITPMLYYTNTWYISYLPFSGADTYDNTGQIYHATRVVGKDGNFMKEEYEKYSPVFMPYKDIIGAFNPGRKKDIHARLIERYPGTKWWWYAVLTVVVLVLTIVIQVVYKTQMPVWGVFVAFALALIYLIPTGSVYAVANLNSNVLTVLGKIISGYALPGP
ncbi:OPT oligopeptide transporter protein-domain-containing protein [Colletotrichum navitas]|uniref:OPT oligopeptide transporter protein-domain-containing protein n=1 Tax=Colletotrichum navitas TaxID=681940 RepID=A0AAD8V0M4_9PEZI|nr:OPT oligopeptide transporter protein-domain-containing protein [Colletotrichum navitas]KAK1573419.1 OPT oligopeptide transporter protein-domain-containing protein [Colletotrichum navitas]